MSDDWKNWSGIATIRNDCEQQAVREGLAGIDLFFRQQELFNERLNAKPLYRDTQKIWLSEQRAKHPPQPDPFRVALEAIRDGHNDPRTLAAEVLSTPSTKEGEG